MAKSKKSILVVEDDVTNRFLLVTLLDGWDYQTHEAGGAHDALQVLAAIDDLDLMIVDLGLPDGNGIDVITAARQRLPRLEVIVSTGAVVLPDGAGIPGPPIRHLVKPFFPDQLKRTIDRLLEPLD